MTDDKLRANEIAKYAKMYQYPWYAMGAARQADAVADLTAIPVRTTLLDVSCGRGEMMAVARGLGFTTVKGTETVPAMIANDPANIVYAMGHALPFADDAFDVVTMFDVMEHVLPGDDELVFKELCRVAKKHVLIAINNHPSENGDGDVLHVNVRPYAEWEALLNAWKPTGSTVVRLTTPTRQFDSATWRINL